MLRRGPRKENPHIFASDFAFAIQEVQGSWGELKTQSVKIVWESDGGKGKGRAKRENQENSPKETSLWARVLFSKNQREKPKL